MNDFVQVAQSLSVAFKALQMYTDQHPRAQQSVAATHALLERWLAEQPKLLFVTTGQKAFVDGQALDSKSPQVATLVRVLSERALSGFSFERGIQPEEILVFLQGLSTKPALLEEQGGFEAMLRAAGVLHIKVAKTRYQEVTEGKESGAEEKAPAFSPAAPPSSTPENLIKFIQTALLSAIAKSSGTTPGGAGMLDGEDLDFLKGFGPADLSGLGPLGRELGLGEGMPTPNQLGTLRQVLMGLAPEVQLSVLAGLGTLPLQPAGLALGVKALAGELLAAATSNSLAKGVTWLQLKGPIQDILRPIGDKERLVRTLTSHLRVSGLDSSQAEAILRHLEWEALSLEAKLLKVLEGGYLYELSLEERLAFLRELLDLRRFDEFLHIQEVLLGTLSSDRSDLRMKAIQTLSGMARWVQDPGLPPNAEGPLSEALRAHFGWEPDPHIHRWTVEALEHMLAALVDRGDFGTVISEVKELEGLCAFLEEERPWRTHALARLHTSLERTQLLDVAISYAFVLERDQMMKEVHPYFEFIGEAMTRQLVSRLGEETDRTRRGRLVEAVRGMGSSALPTLKEALGSSAWYLVRNALTLLSDLGDAGCVPVILTLLRHPEPRVRRTAVRALWKLGGPVAEPHLLAQMKETDGETMQEILFALGQLRSETSLPRVMELAQDKRVLAKLRIQALETLGMIASPKAVPVLLECMRRKGFFSAGEPPTIRLAAAKALAILGTPETQAMLKKAAEAEPKGEERDTLMRLLDRSVIP
jgi:hypothetical protein